MKWFIIRNLYTMSHKITDDQPAHTYNELFLIYQLLEKSKMISLHFNKLSILRFIGTPVEKNFSFIHEKYKN